MPSGAGHALHPGRTKQGEQSHLPVVRFANQGTSAGCRDAIAAFVKREGDWHRQLCGSAAALAGARFCPKVCLTIPSLLLQCAASGGVDEWFKSHAWKACVG